MHTESVILHEKQEESKSEKSESEKTGLNNSETDIFDMKLSPTDINIMGQIKAPRHQWQVIARIAQMKDINVIAVAEALGVEMKPHVKDFVQTFVVDDDNNDFDSSWLLLAPSIVREYLTNETSKYAYPHFCKRTLHTYEFNADYREITYADVIKKYGLVWLNLTTLKIDKRTHLYEVTGSCYKELFMSGTKKSKEFFKVILDISRCIDCLALAKKYRLAKPDSKTKAETKAEAKAEKIDKKEEIYMQEVQEIQEEKKMVDENAIAPKAVCDIFTELQCPEDIKNALIKTEFKDGLTTIQLTEALDIKMTPETREFMTMFQGQNIKNFNESWILLSPDFVKKYMTNEKSERFYVNFLTRKIIQSTIPESERIYIEGTHYHILTKNETIAKYQLNDENNNDNHLSFLRDGKIGNRAKFCEVTGLCFKRLCMSESRIAQEYYLTLELIIDKIITMLNMRRLYLAEKKEMAVKYALEAQKRKNAEQKAELEYLRKQIIAPTPSPIHEKGLIYIAANNANQSSLNYKVGLVKECTRLALKKRLLQYNSSCSADDPFKYCYVKPCRNPALIDHIIKTTLESWKPENGKQKEMCRAPYKAILCVVNQLVSLHEQGIDFHNHQILGTWREYLNDHTLAPYINENTIPLGDEKRDEKQDEKNQNDEKKEDDEYGVSGLTTKEFLKKMEGILNDAKQLEKLILQATLSKEILASIGPLSDEIALRKA